ncbi:MAG TPA: ABC transporter ATP-binding protein, partial [Eubacterium sp.]|nr:ABC transporter ATP-binding protein [Eubacterium sp.]
EPTGALNRSNSDEVMNEFVKINKEGTTIMMVTHDVKVASRCSRVLYIEDGNIRGEYDNTKEQSERDKERALNAWLIDLGW